MSMSTWPHHTASAMAKAYHTIARQSSGATAWDPGHRGAAAIPNNFPDRFGGMELSKSSPNHLPPEFCFQ